MRRREFLRSAAVASLAATTWPVRAARATPVIIAGGGFAGAACALALRRLAPRLPVTLIDPQSPYVTCPMSNSVIAGLRSLGSITVTRAGLERAGVQYLRDSVERIDTDRHAVRLGGGAALSYTRLVVAPGIRLLFGQPEGYDLAAARHMPHAWEGGDSTERLRRRLLQVPDGGTVAISVPAGLMRCPPGPYERASLIAHWLDTHRRRCKVLIFDSNNHFPRQDLFSAAWSELYPGMIEWIAPRDGGAIERVEASTTTLHSSSGMHRVSLANIIPPQAPGLLALRNGLCSGHGWCPVEAPSFESQSLPQVHVIGDACIAGAMPKSASAALAQALQCAAAICATLAERPAASAELKSVCYSLLSPQRALAMHGLFKVSDNEISPADGGAGGTAGETDVSEATTWYQATLGECFAA